MKFFSGDTESKQDKMLNFATSIYARLPRHYFHALVHKNRKEIDY